MPIDQNLVIWIKDLSTMSAEIQQLFNHKNIPDAIFSLNDALAIEVMAILDGMKKKIPEEVALVGVGDLAMTNMERISLTTLKEPLEEMGQKSAELMLYLIHNPSSKSIIKYIEHNELIIRNTTIPKQCKVPGEK